MTVRHIADKLVFIVLSATFLALASCASEPTTEPVTTPPPAAPAADTGAGTHTVTFRVDPDPPAGGKDNTVHVSVQDSSGNPVSDAQVQMTITMPAMPAMNMPEMSNKADLKWTGSHYSGPIQISMAGGWDVVVEARRGNEVLGTHRSRINAK